MADLLSGGLVNIAAGGTPVLLSTNLTVPADGIRCQSFQVQVAPGNAGIVYIGVAGMNKSTGVGVLAQLPKPADATTGPFPSQSFSVPMSGNALDINRIYIDGTTSDKVIVSYIQQ